MLYILFGILAGNALPLQTSVNAGLRKRLGNPFLASLISFLITIATFLLVLLLTEGRLSFPLGNLRGQPFWVWMAGFLGVFFLTGNIVLFPKLGGVKTIICTATGQVLMALVIDSLALFGATTRAAGALRILGAALAVVGVVVVATSKGGRGDRLRASDLLWCAFGVFIGMCSAAQTAINAQVGRLLGAAMKATAVSSMEALPWIVLVMLLLSRRIPVSLAGARQTRPWMWLGGVFGAAYIFSNAWLSSRIGTGLAVVSILIGSTAGGLVIDHFGFFGADRQSLTPVKLLGIVVMLAGAALIRLA